MLAVRFFLFQTNPNISDAFENARGGHYCFEYESCGIFGSGKVHVNIIVTCNAREDHGIVKLLALKSRLYTYTAVTFFSKKQDTVPYVIIAA